MRQQQDETSSRPQRTLEDRGEERKEQRSVHLVRHHLSVEKQLVVGIGRLQATGEQTNERQIHNKNNKFSYRASACGPHVPSLEAEVHIVTTMRQQGGEITKHVGTDVLAAHVDQGRQDACRGGLGGGVPEALEEVAGDGERELLLEAHARDLIELRQVRLERGMARLHAVGREALAYRRERERERERESQ